MKKETLRLSKKLASYSLLANAMMAVSQLSNAQVMYTDIDDETFTDNNTGYFIDLDNNGLTDFTVAEFKFTSNGKSYRKVVGIPATSNSLAGSSQSGYVFPEAFDKNESICASAQWNVYTTSSQIFILASSNNDIGGGNEQHRGKFNAADQYLGMRFTLDGETRYYGWLRLDVAADAGSFTVKDFAYQMNSGISCIETGDTVSVSAVAQPLANNTIQIMAFNRMLFVNTTPSEGDAVVVSIVNLSGQVIYHVKTGNPHFQINLGELHEGIYLVHAEQGTAVKTKKIVLH